MHKNTHNLEIEVKFHLCDPAQTRKHLDAIGALAQPRVFESNVRFENHTGALKKSNRLLRLRQDDGCHLTYKCPPKNQNDQCKIYRELEVDVSDFETMTAILAELGFHGVQVYEKWRQTYSWGNVLICIDTMPYGDFLEIEGPEAGIKAAAEALGLPWKKRILSNYLAMFEKLRTDNQLPFSDVTFGNFRQYPVDITPYLPIFEAVDQAKGNASL